MNHHRNDDENFSRREREWDRERTREGRENEWGRQEGARSSFHPGGSAFDETSRAERSGGEYAPAYGQREPYATSGSGGGSYGAEGYGRYRGEGQGGPHRGRDESRSYSPQDYSRDIGRDYSYGREYGARSDWGRPGRQGAGDESRYSESQYGQHRQDRGSYGSSSGWDEPDRGQYGGGSGYSQRGFGSRNYGGGYGEEQRFGREPRYGGEQQRYGVGYSGTPGYGRSSSSFGNEPFNTGDQPRYYGTGYYGEGTSAFGGGFGEERWGSNPYGSGRFREAQQSSRFYGGGSEQYRGEQQERPGLLRRLFGKGPKGYQRSDERLREDISERLMQTGHIDSSEVMVTVTSGKVTLEGTVPERYMKHSIEDMVDACPGVQDIDNRIRVDRNTAGYGAGTYGAGSTASIGGTSGTGTSYGSSTGSGTSTGSSYGAGSSTGTTGGTSSGLSGGSSSSSGTSNKPTRKDS